MNFNVKQNCSFARNGQEAVDIIVKNVLENGGKKCSYKLILMDTQMPVLNGPEATSMIRKVLGEKQIL